VISRPVIGKYLAARSFDVPTNVLDITRAKTFLDWQPETSFYDGLSRTFAWLEARKRSEASPGA